MATTKPRPVQDSLDARGVDWLCDQLAEGKMLTAIAKAAKTSMRTMSDWIAADPKRAAQVKEARIASAEAYAEKAEQVLLAAKTPLQLQKARELAHHYRWKASKLDPRRFGDKLAVGGADDLPPLKRYTDEQLAAHVKRLQEKVNGGQG